MGCLRVVGVVVLLCLGLSHLAVAETSPTQAVQSFVDAIRKGRFAEAQSYLLDQVDVSSSLFGNWLFNSGAANSQAATADIFFSRKFAEVFRFAIIDTANNGDYQAFVTATRTTPHMGHLYAWALAPQQNALPYTLVEAIDTYLTKVNYPIEESGVQFTLVRELEDWYISAIHDEKFKQLREQLLTQPPLSSVSSVAPLTPAAPAPPAAQPLASTTSTNLGRQTADAQFQATLQGLNKVPQAPAAAAEAVPEEKKGFFSRVGRVFGIGRKKDDEALVSARPSVSATAPVTTPAGAPVSAPPPQAQTANAQPTSLRPISNAQLERRLKIIRNALAVYAGANYSVPNEVTIYNWKTLRDVVNFYSRKQLPASESQAGFRFVDYRTVGIDDYTLLVQIETSEAGPQQLEVNPNGVQAVN